VTTADDDCVKMSTAFKTTCDSYVCGTDYPGDCDMVNFDPDNELCKSKLCCSYEWDTSSGTGVSVLTPQTCDKTDHKVKLLYAKYDMNWDGDHSCCNTCSEGFNGDFSSTSAREFKAMCKAESFQGPGVCGTTGNDMETGSSTYYLECATGPKHTLTGTSEECEWDESQNKDVCEPETCSFTPDNLKAFLDAAPKSREDYEKLPADTQRAGALHQYNRAFVTNGPDAVNKAVVELNVKSDVKGETCAAVLLEPTMEAGSTLDATGGFAYVSNPEVAATGEIKVSGAADFTVFGGSNAGKIILTDVTGSVQVAGTTNSGPITATGVKGLFIVDVENKVGGNIEATNTEASLYNVVNHADVTVVGGKFNAYSMENHGTVTITGAEVNGAIRINTGTINLISCTGTFAGPEGGGTDGGTVTASGAGSTVVVEVVTEDSNDEVVTDKDGKTTTVETEAEIAAKAALVAAKAALVAAKAEVTAACATESAACTQAKKNVADAEEVVSQFESDSASTTAASLVAVAVAAAAALF